MDTLPFLKKCETICPALLKVLNYLGKISCVFNLQVSIYNYICLAPFAMRHFSYSLYFKTGRTAFSLMLLVVCCMLKAQTGPAGVGTNVTSTNQNRFWLKADAGVYIDNGLTLAANGNSVQQWNDQSGVANNATQTTVSYKPVYATNMVNGFPAIRFFGNSFVTGSAYPGIANNVGYTYLICFKDTAYTAGAMGDGNGDYIIDRGLPGPEGNELCSFKITNTNLYGFQKRDAGGGGLGGPVSTSSVSNGNYRIINYRQAPGAIKVYDLFVDGALESSVSSADGDYVPPVPQIGHHYQPANSGLKGYVTEVILYNYNINNAQANILNSYLAAKYGLTLTANDKYAGDVPGINYDFEVAGVGKDPTGNNLSAASSISGGLDVTQATLMENNEYLVYGHQSGANAMNFSDIGGMSPGPWVGRWNRIWYLDWTHIGGTTETANLTFDMSDGGLPVTPAAPLTNYKLLYRTGLSGNWTEIANASSISGDRISFNGIPYTQGDGFYTIGTLNNNASPLPVELTSFTAKCIKGEVVLDWATASSQNISDFNIERSADGASFETIGSFPVVVYKGQPSKYSYTDQAPLTGVSYYRLRQTDNDGSEQYSAVVSAICDLGTSDTRIFNNGNNSLVVEGAPLNSTVQLADIFGVIVSSQKTTSETTFVDLNTLPAGVYYVKVETPSKNNVQKIVVAK